MAFIGEMNRWNEVMWLITDTLPKAQVEAPQFQVHISYFLQKCKKGKPIEIDLPLKKRYHNF